MITAEFKEALSVQEAAAGHSRQDPGPAVLVPAPPQPGVLAGQLVGALPGSRAVRQHRRLPALLPADVVHLGGAGGAAHVPEHHPGVHALPEPLHAEVHADGLGWVRRRAETLGGVGGNENKTRRCGVCRYSAHRGGCCGLSGQRQLRSGHIRKIHR